MAAKRRGASRIPASEILGRFAHLFFAAMPELTPQEISQQAYPTLFCVRCLMNQAAQNAQAGRLQQFPLRLEPFEKYRV